MKWKKGLLIKQGCCKDFLRGLWKSSPKLRQLTLTHWYLLNWNMNVFRLFHSRMEVKLFWVLENFENSIKDIGKISFSIKRTNFWHSVYFLGVGGGVAQNIWGLSMVQNLHSGLSFGLCEGNKKSQARPKSKQFVRCVVSRWLSNAGDHKSKLRSIELQLLTQFFRIKCFLLNVPMSPLVGISLSQQFLKCRF